MHLCDSRRFWKSGKSLLYITQNQSELFTWLSKILEKLGNPFKSVETILSVTPHLFIKYSSMYKIC